MNEHEFRDSLRASMSANPEPPPMGDGPVLDAAKRDSRRRRAMWAGASSAAAVVAIAVGVVVVAPSSGGDGGVAAGVAPPKVETTGNADPSGTDKQTETSWPNGQTDRTQTAGPEADKGVALLTELEAVVPAGYETPDDLVGNGELAGSPMRTHQAQYQDTIGGVEVWDYLADVGVKKGDSVGRLLVQVITPGGQVGDGCELKMAWGLEGKCTEVVVGGKAVGVTTDADPTGEIDQFEQWAVYRHDDGTVVGVAQSTFRAFTDFAPLDGPLFTAQQLAELATDARFHVD